MNPPTSPSSLTALQPHPAHPAPAGVRLAADMKLEPDGRLTLDYELLSPPGTLIWPAPASPGPADGLWQATCFEAFVSAGGPGYHEFNFSPSGQWAFYRFSAERQRSTDSTGPGVDGFTPRLDGRHEGNRYTLHVHLPASALPPSTDGSWLAGLSAVLQATDGRLSYWALHHPVPGRPDFHHPDGRVLRLTRPRNGHAAP